MHVKELFFKEVIFKLEMVNVPDFGRMSGYEKPHLLINIHQYMILYNEKRFKLKMFCPLNGIPGGIDV
jgi:hypothetical protein